MARISEQVWQHWDDVASASEEPAVVLLFSSPLPQREAIAALDEAAAAAAHALDAAAVDPEFHAGSWSLAPVPGGVAVRIDEEPDDFDGLVRGIATELDRRGVDGSFDVYEPEDVVELPDAVALLECRLRVRGTRRPARGVKWRWEADSEALEAGVDQALDWCTAGPGRRLGLVVGLVASATIPSDENLRETMLVALDRTVEFGVVTLTSAGPERFRTVAVEPSTGRVTLIQGGAAVEAGGWRQSLLDLENALRSAGPWAAYGFVKRGAYRTAAELGTSLAQDWIDIARFDPGTSVGVAFEAEFAPDAFGLQLLGSGYGGRVPGGGDWSAIGVGGGGSVVAHADPAAWFDGGLVQFRGFPISTPPASVPEFVARARRDFDDILFDVAVARGPGEP